MGSTTSLALACCALLFTACERGGEVSPPVQQAVLVHLKLADGAFGSDAEREAIFRLERELEQAIAAVAAGELDGNEFGDGRCTLYLYGPSAEALFRAIAPVLASSPAARGASVIERAGPPGSPEQKHDL